MKSSNPISADLHKYTWGQKTAVKRLNPSPLKVNRRTRLNVS